ncbi:nucleobase:cation symporter-2 family protein [Saccharopolyspora sp. NPDC050389]|uniref:nucleobase:cation symporter-2 family protein n=1 Tax=Saccharopolyspora sp. NPDC050389 TaxID=3155516 RepID=UPI0033FE0EB5
MDEVPAAGRLFSFGLQHALVMYAGAIAVPLVFGEGAGLDTKTVGMLINADLLVAGIVTLIQGLGVGRLLGARLPLVTGGSFVCITPMIMIAHEYGLPAVWGSMLVSGLFGLAIAFPFARALRYFPPLVSGIVITVVGLALLGVVPGMIAGDDPASADYARVDHLALAAGAVFFVVVLRRFTRGFIAQVSVLLALAGGTLAAIPMGITDFSGLGGADWFGVVTPLHFGAPEFPVAGILSMCVVMLVVFAESTAQMIAVSEAVDKPLGDRDLARGLAADGLSGVLGGAMNSFPDTVFAGNVGLTIMTGVRSRYVTAVAGMFMIVLGAIPKLGEFIAALPEPVIGGISLLNFATVTAVGVNILRRAGLDRGDNLLIAAVSIGVGMLPVVAPEIYHRFPGWWQLIFGSPSVAALIVAFTLNLAFHHTRKPGATATPTS